jgi:hypothetical protein
MAKKKAGSDGKGGAKGIGRWVPIGMKPVTAEWKNINPSDEHLIFLLDSATGEITVCGDTSGVRAGVGGSTGSALVAAPTSLRKTPRRKS